MYLFHCVLEVFLFPRRRTPFLESGTPWRKVELMIPSVRDPNASRLIIQGSFTRLIHFSVLCRFTCPIHM